jgi:hypothetical protein
LKKFLLPLLLLGACSTTQQATAPCPACATCPNCPPAPRLEVDTIYQIRHDTMIVQAPLPPTLPVIPIYDTIVITIPTQNSKSVYELPLPTGGDDQAILQANCDTAVARGYRLIHLPGVGYRVSQGLLFRNPSGAFLQGVKIYADGGDYGDVPTICSTNPAGFALNVVGGKGVIIEGIHVQGLNTGVSAYGVQQVCSGDTTSFVTNGVSASRFAPHAGFVVDGINYANPPVYPGGSTDVQFINCRAQFFTVDYCLQPGGAKLANGEKIRIINCWGDYCRSAISTGQAQERSVSVEHFGCWGWTKTVFDCSNFGSGTSCPPDVSDFNGAGCIRYLCELGQFISKGLTVKNSHMESLYSLGGCFAGLSNILTLEDCWTAFQGNSNGSPNPAIWYQGSELHVRGGKLFQYGAPNPVILAYNITISDFIGVDFDWIPIYPKGTAPVFIDCTADGNPFGSDMVVSQGHIPAELSSSWFIWMGKSSISYGSVGGEGWGTVRTRVIDTSQYGYMMPQLVVGDLTAGSDTVKNVAIEGGTAYFAIPPALAMPELPAGTTIKSISITGDTLILTAPSLVTETGAAILGGNWHGESYGQLPDPQDPYHWGWKIGDHITNSRQDLYPGVVGWICTQSGITGTWRPPQFKAQ